MTYKDIKEKYRDKVYKILELNDATQKAGWWNIASEIVDEFILKQVIPMVEKETKEKIIKGVVAKVNESWQRKWKGRVKEIQKQAREKVTGIKIK